MEVKNRDPKTSQNLQNLVWRKAYANKFMKVLCIYKSLGITVLYVMWEN